MSKSIFVTFSFLITLFLLGCTSKNEVINQKTEIINNFIAYEEDGQYAAWPMIIRATNGDILVSFCRAEEHVSPTGETVIIRSSDKGKTWSKPVVLRNTPLDDRGCSMIKLKDGRILASVLSVYHPTELFSESFVKSNSYPVDALNRWAEYTRSELYKNAKDHAGSFFYISSDNGNSWKDMGRGKDFFHNAIEFDDGTLLLPFYNSKNQIIINKTNIKADSFIFTADTIQAPQNKSYGFGEPDILRLPNGRIIMILRTTASNPYDDKNFKNLMWETYSDDNGKTWVDMYPLPLWGFPGHLLLLQDGRVLCTYGYRREPYGIRACISEDGITWKHENEIILRDDAPNHDLGYPVSLEMESGLIMTLYYQPNVPKGTIQEIAPPKPDRKKPGILGTFWKVAKR